MTHTLRPLNTSRATIAACVLLSFLTISGCANPFEAHFSMDKPVDANLNGNLKADAKLDTTLKGDLAAKLEMAPITINMTGPTIRYTGTFVTKESFDRVNTGNTRTDWLKAVIGEPDLATTLDDGSIIWKYFYAPVEQSGSLISVFGGKDEPSPKTIATFFRINNTGTVIEKWRD